MPTETATRRTSRGTPTFPPRSIQENIITALCHNEQAGKIVANLADPDLFEGDFRLIANAAVGYWRQHNKPPGVHIADLLRSTLERGGRQATGLQRTLWAMIQLAEHLDPDFVVSDLEQWIRRQKMKDAVLRGAEKLVNDSTPLAEVEDIFSDLLRTRNDPLFVPPIPLGDISGFMAHLAAAEANEFATGIAELDSRHVVPARKQVMVLLGATGMGKSWALVHFGRAALDRHKKVLHVTLELAARDVQMRYLQNFLALPKYEFDLTATRSRLVVNNEGLLTGFASEQVEAPIWLQDDPRRVKAHLERLINRRPAKFADLRIKDFPPRSLSVTALRGYLHNLDAGGFVPDVLLIDYAGLMQIDPDNYRIAFGRVIEDLCGLATEHNVAVVTAEQVSKEGAKAKQVDISHVAESWATVLPVDAVLSFTRTDKEKPHKLARLFVVKNRHGADGFGAVLAQNYQHGQFALQSAALPQQLADYTGLLEDEDEDRP
jgi:hypothetical protein